MDSTDKKMDCAVARFNCAICDGYGMIPRGDGSGFSVCPNCKGKAKIEIPIGPDIEERVAILEARLTMRFTKNPLEEGEQKE